MFSNSKLEQLVMLYGLILLTLVTPSNLKQAWKGLQLLGS